MADFIHLIFGSDQSEQEMDTFNQGTGETSEVPKDTVNESNYDKACNKISAMILDKMFQN